MSQYKCTCPVLSLSENTTLPCLSVRCLLSSADGESLNKWQCENIHGSQEYLGTYRCVLGTKMTSGAWENMISILPSSPTLGGTRHSISLSAWCQDAGPITAPEKHARLPTRGRCDYGGRAGRQGSRAALMATLEGRTGVWGCLVCSNPAKIAEGPELTGRCSRVLRPR